jgi:glyceraldehyde-3-phosphate dehydrogenase/erythrose-4-phosphate dehydrogenase
MNIRLHRQSIDGRFRQDIVFVTARGTSVEEVNQVFTEEAAGDRYREVLAVTQEPIVSSDTIQQSSRPSSILP